MTNNSFFKHINSNFWSFLLITLVSGEKISDKVLFIKYQ